MESQNLTIRGDFRVQAQRPCKNLIPSLSSVNVSVSAKFLLQTGHCGWVSGSCRVEKAQIAF